jgi:hypothetical protein
MRGFGKKKKKKKKKKLPANGTGVGCAIATPARSFCAFPHPLQRLPRLVLLSRVGVGWGAAPTTPGPLIMACAVRRS